MLTLEIKKLTSHITLLFHINGKNYPIEIKNYSVQIPKIIESVGLKTFCVSIIKQLGEMIKDKEHVNIFAHENLGETTAIVNQMIEYFDDLQ